MTFLIHCPTCRYPLTVDESQVSSVVGCPTCRYPLTASAPSTAAFSNEPNQLKNLAAETVVTGLGRSRRHLRQHGTLSTLSIFTLAFMICGLTIGGVWLFIHLNDKMRTEDSAIDRELTLASGSVAQLPLSKRPTGQSAGLTLPKGQTKEKSVDLLQKPEIAPLLSPYTLTDVKPQCLEEANRLMMEFEAEFPQKRKLLTAEELEKVETFIHWKTEDGNFPRDWLQYLADHQAMKWVQATALRWAVRADFEKVGKWIWNRSPKSRNFYSMTELAMKWGLYDLVTRSTIHGIMDIVEGKRPGRELLADERNIVVLFAGEEYYLNRP